MKNLLSLILIIALTNFTLTAQSLLEGSISTENGTTLTSTTVVLHHITNENLTKILTVDDTGYFLFENIEEGAYQLEVTNANYESIIVDNFQFPRDTDQVLGLSFQQSLPVNPTVNAETQKAPNDNLSTTKVY